MGLTIWIYYNYMDMLYGLTIYIFFKWYPIDILVFDQWDINWALYGYFKCLNLLLSFKKWGYNQRATVNILFLRGSKIGHALLMFFLVVDTFIVDTFWWFLRCGKKQQQQLLRYRIAFCPASIFFLLLLEMTGASFQAVYGRSHFVSSALPSQDLRCGGPADVHDRCIGRGSAMDLEAQLACGAGFASNLCLMETKSSHSCLAGAAIDWTCRNRSQCAENETGHHDPSGEVKCFALMLQECLEFEWGNWMKMVINPNKPWDASQVGWKKSAGSMNSISHVGLMATLTALAALAGKVVLL